MTALYIIGGIVLLFLLIGLIPIGADASYGEDGFALSARVWLFNISLGGGKKPKKQKKPKKEKKKKKEEPEAEKKKKKLPPLEVIQMALKRVFRLLCRLVSGLRVELLRIHFTAGFDDPCTTALAYGAAGTAMETLLQLGEKNIARHDLRVDADFDAAEPIIDFRIRITIRIGRLVGAVLGLVFGFMRDFLPYKLREAGAAARA